MEMKSMKSFWTVHFEIRVNDEENVVHFLAEIFWDIKYVIKGGVTMKLRVIIDNFVQTVSLNENRIKTILM